MPHKAYYSSKIQQTTAKETAISIAIKQLMTMKTVFISYDQAHHDGVIEALSSSMCRGYTILPEAGGMGTAPRYSRMACNERSHTDYMR